MSTTPVASAMRQNLLAKVLEGVVAMDAQYSTDADYAALLKITARGRAVNSVELEGSPIKSYPLLYWGDPTTARFATFGVIPSADEFTSGRWPNSMTLTQLDDRLVSYFNNSVHRPNDWFDGYDDTVNNDKALNILGHSYRRDTVHLDLSPRATIAMGRVSEKTSLKTRFLEMVISDMQLWFLSALALCGNVKAAIMSGSVTKDHYFDEFLCKYLPPRNHYLKLKIPFGTGRGATALYELVGPGFTIPVFFCGTSPSARRDKGKRLAMEISRNLLQLPPCFK